MLIGTGFVAGYLVFDLAITEPNWLALAALAHGYAGASGASQQSYVAAAQYGLALMPFLNLLSFVVSGVGFMLIAIVMSRNAFFRRSTAYFEMGVMVLAIAGGIGFVVPGLAGVVFPVLLGFGAWCVARGLQLYGLPSRIARFGGEHEAKASTSAVA